MMINIHQSDNLDVSPHFCLPFLRPLRNRDFSHPLVITSSFPPKISELINGKLKRRLTNVSIYRKSGVSAVNASFPCPSHPNVVSFSNWSPQKRNSYK